MIDGTFTLEHPPYQKSRKLYVIEQKALTCYSPADGTLREKRDGSIEGSTLQHPM